MTKPNEAYKNALLADMSMQMTFLQIQILRRMALALLTVVTMTACGPSDKQRAAGAEEQRISCLDKICPGNGDVIPKIDSTKEAILKVNGQWYVGPKEYYTSSGPRGFIWWKQKPITTVEPRPPELEALIANGKRYDFSVEIFFTGRRRWPTPSVEKPWEGLPWAKRIERMEAVGFGIERTKFSPELDVLRFKQADGKLYDAEFYIAIQEKRIRGIEPPVLACTISVPPHAADSCKSGEYWQPDVYADFRLSAKHATDWPAIHQEIIRVLNLAKKVQP